MDAMLRGEFLDEFSAAMRVVDRQRALEAMTSLWQKEEEKASK